MYASYSHANTTIPALMATNRGNGYSASFRSGCRAALRKPRTNAPAARIRPSGV